MTTTPCSSSSSSLSRRIIAPLALASMTSRSLALSSSSASSSPVKLQLKYSKSRTNSSYFGKRFEIFAEYVIMVVPPLFTAILLTYFALISGRVVVSRGLSILSSLGSQQNLSPVIKTLDGPVQGKLGHSRNGRPFWQFLGIPFSDPPLGKLRFQPPYPVKPWKKVRQVLQYPPGCVQFEPVALVRTWGVEDCLFLNVFAPKSEDVSELKPVLVYIHGGAFLEGQSSFYRPDYIMDHDVVVVTFNYRLGPLGFLNFEEKNDTTGNKIKYPRGNMGLKDQNMVLKWVQKNIAHFGGDPGKVTLMADSAGAVSLHFHMLSPMSQGLFHKAISISGSSLCPWGFTQKPRQIAFQYGNRIGCPTENTTSLLECYLNMDPHKMVSMQLAWADPIHEKDEFIPSVEPLVTGDTFITESPQEMLKNGRPTANVPLLAGVTSGEGGLRSGRFRAIPESIPILEEKWEALVDRVLFLDDPLPSEVALDLRQYYFGNVENFTRNTSAFFDGMTKLTSDALFVGPVHRAAVHHAKMGNPTYMFYYDYRPVAFPGTYSFFSQVGISENFIERWTKIISGIIWDWILEYAFGGKGAHEFGVGHAEDVVQIWNINGLTKWLTGPDLDFSRGIIQAIVDFTVDLKPLSYRGLQWPRINDHVEPESSSLNIIPYMKFDNAKNPQIIWEPFRERLQFWDTLRSTKYQNI